MGLCLRAPGSVALLAPFCTCPLPTGLLPYPACPPCLQAAGRSSWKYFVEKVDEPGDSKGLQVRGQGAEARSAALKEEAPGGCRGVWGVWRVLSRLSPRTPAHNAMLHCSVFCRGR